MIMIVRDIFWFFRPPSGRAEKLFSLFRIRIIGVERQIKDCADSVVFVDEIKPACLFICPEPGFSLKSSAHIPKKPKNFRIQKIMLDKRGFGYYNMACSLDDSDTEE